MNHSVLIRNKRLHYYKPDTAFRIWYEHYQDHLKRLYQLFQETRNDSLVPTDKTFQDFCQFIYSNSDKYLIQWL